MNKKRIEIILLFGVLLFGFLSFQFYGMSKKIITKKEIVYQENGSVNYKVYLSDKKYYNKEYLDEGMQYISGIIDYIDLNYRYKINFDKKDEYNVSTKVVADVKIVDSDNNDKIIFEKKETLKDTTTKVSDININDEIKLDYKKYNALTNEFKTNYGISANCKLYLDYIISYDGVQNKLGKAPITIKVMIPLSEQMVNITKDPNISNNSSIIIESSGNVIMFVLALAFVLLTVVTLAAFFVTLKNRIDSESKYERFVKKILRDNDSYITIAKEYNVDKTKNIIKIDSFKELMDVRNNIEKPIVYTELDNDNSVFSIMDNEIYEYRVSRGEMDK